jgi:hypothetical protein
MTNHEKQVFFTTMLATFLHYAIDSGYEVVVDTVARSKEEQARLVKIGASQTMKSKHVERLAVDLLLFKNGKYLTGKTQYDELGAVWKTLSTKNVWGGDWITFKDYGHFEYAG